MKLTKANGDFIFLGILGALLLGTMLITFFTDYELTSYQYAAQSCWIAVLLIRIFRHLIGRYLTAVLLLLGTFNAVNFILVRTRVGSLGFDPYIALLTIIYYLVNRKSVNRVLLGLFRGSEQEITDKQAKMVSFYFDKFKALPKPEFDKIFNNIHTYPPEAQEAIHRLFTERNKPAAPTAIS